jgi:hypothetical protein
MSAIARFPFQQGASTDEANDPATTTSVCQLGIERDEARLDAVTLWLQGWLDRRAVTQLVDECRTRLSRGQRVLVDLSGLDGIDPDAAEPLHALSAHGCLLFNSTRSLFPGTAPHVRDRRVNTR